MARLSYANLKVNQGWIKQNIDEVEHLYVSRFKGQAEQRRSRKFAPINGIVDTTAWATRDILPPLKEEDYSTTAASRSGHLSFPFGPARPPPGRPFAEDTDNVADPVGPGPLANTQYHGYAPGLYTGAHHGISVYAPADQNQPSTLQHGRLHSHSGSWDSNHLQTGVLSSSHQPTFNMYSYLASPVAGSSAQFVDPSVQGRTTAPSRFPLGTGYTSSGSGFQDDFSSSLHPPLSSSSGLANNATYQADLGTPGVQAPMGAAAAQYFANRAAQDQYPMAPVPAITPRPDLSASTFGPVGASQASYTLNNSRFASKPIPGHIRNPSLRGEYSVSNVTMDDLDSHFGQ